MGNSEVGRAPLRTSCGGEQATDANSLVEALETLQAKLLWGEALGGFSAPPALASRPSVRRSPVARSALPTVPACWERHPGHAPAPAWLMQRPICRLNMLINFFWSPGGLAIVITIAIPVPSKHKRKTSRRFPSPGSMAALWFALR